jgi:hypothetical protein
VRTIYDTLPLYNKGITGAGQKIVIIDRRNLLMSDIPLFRNTFGLPPYRILQRSGYPYRRKCFQLAVKCGCKLIR